MRVIGKLHFLKPHFVRLVTELSRLGEKVGYRHKKLFPDPPKTVDELLDSFNDTPV